MPSLRDVVVFSDEDLPFKGLAPRRVRTQAQFEKALRGSTASTLWVSCHADEFDPFLAGLARDPELFLEIAKRTARGPVLLSLERIRTALETLLQSLFRRIVVADKKRFLPRAQLAEVLASDNAAELAVGGEVHPELRALTLFKGDLSILVAPFSAFRATAAGVRPDFDRFEVADHGQTIRLGAYEASMDSLLYEFDPEHRKRRKSRLLAVEKSFGASLRRLRLQRELRQTHFPGITEKEIGRIERGEVRRPHAGTIEKLAEILKVKPHEIETF